MSDPVTQAEIEDVLSSIRRLVSEDGRVAPRPVSAQAVENRGQSQPVATAQELPKPTSRLVLTPALRVAENVSNAAERNANQPEAAVVSAEVSEGREPACDLPDGSYMDLEVEPELDPGEVLAFRRNDTVESDRVVAHEPVEQHSAAEQPETLPEQPEALLDRPEALPDQAAEGVEQEETAPWCDPEATLFGAVEPSSEDAAEANLDADQASGDQASEHQASEDQAEELYGSQRVSAVVQKIAELEAKVARASGQWEPDGASSDPYAGTNIETLEWQDHMDEAEAEFDADQASQGHDETDTNFDAAALAEEAVTGATMDALDVGGAEESYLDEESLRELVADIVRSELQGALGERITRNVRKLVRREIQRALAAQDLI
ncbi:hypothetical protein [Pseudophaeobacter arcticus]|uniref:hypothetical protein n=1 Tax=Pseudophaeobacter arcticus TaxID=385492 RepID=UPI002492FC07|nr:hypothetical protein [Pseudophaeobacter arcticus]